MGCVRRGTSSILVTIDRSQVVCATANKTEFRSAEKNEESSTLGRRDMTLVNEVEFVGRQNQPLVGGI